MSDKKRYTKNGKVAVIYSPNYGTGYLETDLDMFDPILAEMIDKNENYDSYLDELAEKLKKQGCEYWYEPPFFKGGKLKLKWFNKGDIIEHDTHAGYDKIWSIGNIDQFTVA